MNDQKIVTSSKLRRQSYQLGAVLVVSIASALCILYAISASFVTRSLRDIEVLTVRQAVRRSLNTIDSQLQGLLITTCDYSRWDDFYRYVVSGNVDFETNILDPELSQVNLALLDVNIIAVLLTDGQFRYAQQAKPNSRPVPLQTSVQRYLSSWLRQNTPLEQTTQQAGWIPTDEGLSFVAICPSTDTLQTQPANGALVLGRTVDQNQIAAISEQVQAPIFLINLAQSLNSTEQQVRDRLTTLPSSSDPLLPDEAIVVLPVDTRQIAGYARIDDIAGNPIALLRVELARNFYQQGLLANRLLATILLVAGSIFGGVGWWLLRRLLHESQRLARSEEALAQESALRQADARFREKAMELEIALADLSREQERSESLLLNVLPEPIVQRLKHNQTSIADQFDNVTILFADIVNFTPLASRLQPMELVEFLNSIFSKFDNLVEALGLEKIKTIGDAYMVAAGLPIPRADHAEAIAELALNMQQVTADLRSKTGEEFQIRIGIHTGAVVAGVIGTKKFIYDLWGDTVNVASRMESTAVAGGIQVTSTTHALLKNLYEFEIRGTIQIKGKGAMETYWLRKKIKPKINDHDGCCDAD